MSQSNPASAPLSAEELQALNHLQIGMSLPEPCLPGVTTNLALLAHHRGILESFDPETGEAS
jgi:hypothetical protein